MTLLSSIFSGGSSPTLIGEAKQILSGNTRTAGAIANTITEASGGVWVRANAVYQQSAYPELFAKIGLVGTTIGATRQLPFLLPLIANTQYQLGLNTAYLTGATAYSSQDDLYVFPVFGHYNYYAYYSYTSALYGNVYIANSSLQTFSLKSVGSNTGYITGAAYGGLSGNQRFVFASNSGTYTLYGSNLTVSGPVTTTKQSNIIAGDANVFVTWDTTNTTIYYSATSGATWSSATPNVANAVGGVVDLVYGNVSGNSVYLISTGFSVETSTNLTKWSGIDRQGSDPARTTNKLALGTSNVYMISMIDPGSGGSPNVATTNLNIAPAIFTSTDTKFWDYRGSYSTAEGIVVSQVGNGSRKISSIANGANTLIAMNDWWFNYSPTYGQTCQTFRDPNYGEIAADCQAYVTGQVISSVGGPYNRIFSANSYITTTVSANVFSFSGVCPSTHNNWVIRAMAYGYANNATYYMYGTSGGNVATSVDGITWVDRGTLSGSPHVNHIIYGTANSTNTFIILANNGSIFTTQNAVTYTSRTTAYGLDGPGWGSGAFGNANGTLLYVLGSNTGNLLISNDGIQFSGVNSLANIAGSAYGNNRFVIAMPSGVAKYSGDGIYWSNTGSIVGAANDLFSIATDNVKFVYVGQGGRVGYTYDVTGAWTNATITTSNTHYSAYYAGNASPTGWIIGGVAGSLFTSTDGITWTARNSTTTNTILSVFQANGIYFYGGDGVLATSTDAITWTKRNPDSNNPNNLVRISSFGFGNGVYIYGATGMYGTSTDAVTWVTVPAGYARDVTFTDGSVATRGGSNLNAAGVGLMTYGTYTGAVTSILYNNSNSIFVSVGTYGYIATSTNGNSWITQNSKTGEVLSSIAYGNNRYLVVGANGTTKISPNAVLWSGHASNANIHSIAYYANTVNTFILVGATRSANLGNANSYYTGNNAQTNANISFTLETSNDGIYWIQKPWKTGLPPQHAVGGNTIAAIMEFNEDGRANNNPRINNIPRISFSNGVSGISFSTDTTNWSGLGFSYLVGAGATRPNISISFANNRFIATANSGLFATSNDGIYWAISNVYPKFFTGEYDRLTNVYNNQYYGTWTIYNVPFGVQNYASVYYQGAGVFPGDYIPAAGSFNGRSMSFNKMKYHAATGTYILPHNSGVVTFTSKDLTNWTPRLYTYMQTNYNTDGPLVITYVNNSNGAQNMQITYSNNMNTYVSSVYNVASEFLVPEISSNANSTGGWNPDSQWNNKADAIWYIKAKT